MSGITQRIFSNILSGYLSFFVSCLIFYFLTPYMVSKIGKETFGLWTLVFSCISFFELLDFGFYVGVIKHVAHFKAKEDLKGQNEALSTTFFTYLALAGVGVVGLGILGIFFNDFFAIPTPYHRVALILLALLTFRAMFICLPFALFKGLLFGEQRIYLINWITILTTSFYGLMIFLFLHRGYGLLALGGISVVTAFLEHCLYIWMGYRLNPDLHISYRLVKKERLKEMTVFSSMQFIAQLTEVINVQSAPLMIQFFYNLEAVTLFSIASKVISYLYRAIKQFTYVLTPVIAHYNAQEKKEHIQKILLMGSKYALAPATMAVVGGMIFGDDLIAWWMGPGFSLSAAVLRVLLVTLWLSTMQMIAINILGLTGHEHLFARYFVISSLVNLGSSLLLIPLIGPLGAAFGTLCAAGVGLFLWLRAACHLQGVPFGRFIKEVVGPNAVAAVADVVVTIGCKGTVVPSHLIEVLLLCLPGAFVFSICFWCLLAREEKLRILHAAKGLLK